MVENGNGVIMMRKYIVGIFIGFCLSFAVGAHAEVMSMIGKVVTGEYDFTINNDKLESKSIIVDGVAYIPARLMGNTAGYIVRFDETTGLKLIKKITTPPETIKKSIDVLNNAIARNETAIKTNEEELDRLKKEKQTEQVLMDIITIESTIKKMNEDIAGCRDQINKLNQTLSDIDAQQAELAK